MGQIFFLGLFAALSVASLARPWIGVVGAYWLVLLTPQAIWYWNFEGLRPALWIILPTLVGFVFAAMRGSYTISAVANRRNAYMSILWLCFALSYFFGPYVDAQGPYRFSDPGWVIETLNKILLLYFVACVCLDSEKKLRVLTWVMVGSAVYLTYWANDRYLSGYVMGRMPGPRDVNGMGTYADENTFALLFVVAQPFLWSMGLATKRLWLRWGLWLVIPFAWHAVFLTASRGGLVGLVVVTLLMALRSKHRMLAAALIPAFVIAYQWQAGDLMKSRAETIDEYRTEESAATRVEAWTAAIRMIGEHPFVGVGLGSFGPAFPDFSDAPPREAHNTFFQISAESGLLAGVLYVMLMLGSIAALWRNGARLAKQGPEAPQGFLYLVNEATLLSLVGLATCALFLSLQMFEIVYFLLLMTNVVLFVSARARNAEQANAVSQERLPEAGGRPARPRRNAMVSPRQPARGGERAASSSNEPA